jgi:hypothetical protein
VEKTEAGPDTYGYQNQSGNDLAEYLLVRFEIEYIIDQADEAGYLGTGQDAEKPSKRRGQMFLIAEIIETGQDPGGYPDEHSDAAEIGDGALMGLYPIIRPINDPEFQCSLFA